MSGLTPEEREELHRKQKKFLIFAIVAGLIVAVLGYFAGSEFRRNRDAKPDATSTSAIVRVIEGVNEGGHYGTL